VDIRGVGQRQTGVGHPVNRRSCIFLALRRHCRHVTCDCD
jgi:hypothetical protein